MQTAKVDQTSQGERLDSFLMKHFKLTSRSFLKSNWNKLVLLNGKSVKPSYKLKIGNEIQLNNDLIEDLLKEKTPLENIVPQEGNLTIVKETEDFLIINKEKGIPVHPGIGFKKDTLANYVVGYLSNKNEYDPRVERGGIVHRLDKSVSGLIVFAKNLEAQKYLQKEFEDHRVNKVYLAKIVSHGNISNEIKEYFPSQGIEPSKELSEFTNSGFNINEKWYKAEGYIGRSNINRRKMMFKTYPFDNAKYALSYILPTDDHTVLVNIKTGRMYQIRATLEYLGINIVGDTLFETQKGGKTPESIELGSVLLSFKAPDGNIVTNCLL